MWWNDNLIVDDILNKDFQIKGILNHHIRDSMFYHPEYDINPDRLESFIGKECEIRYPAFEDCHGYELVFSEDFPIFKFLNEDTQAVKLLKQVNLKIANASKRYDLLVDDFFCSKDCKVEHTRILLVDDLKCLSNVEKFN